MKAQKTVLLSHTTQAFVPAGPSDIVAAKTHSTIHAFTNICLATSGLSRSDLRLPSSGFELRTATSLSATDIKLCPSDPRLEEVSKFHPVTVLLSDFSIKERVHHGKVSRAPDVRVKRKVKKVFVT